MFVAVRDGCGLGRRWRGLRCCCNLDSPGQLPAPRLRDWSTRPLEKHQYTVLAVSYVRRGALACADAAALTTRQHLGAFQLSIGPMSVMTVTGYIAWPITTIARPAERYAASAGCGSMTRWRCATELLHRGILDVGHTGSPA